MEPRTPTAVDRFALFGAPVFVFDAIGSDPLNNDLSDHLLKERESTKGLVRSNVGGWHSIPDLSQRPLFQEIINPMLKNAGKVVGLLAGEAGQPCPRFRYGVQGWAMILGAGDYVVPHTHGDAHWSAAYYVDSGDPPGADSPSGALAFVDASRAGRPVEGLDLFPSTFTVQPRSGMLVLFPGWLSHHVHPYRGARPRISLSFNIVMEAVRD